MSLTHDLSRAYGSRYNDGEDVGLGGGYAAPGHWENSERWKLSARGVLAAARCLISVRHPSILDVGCGRGALVRELRALGSRAVGLDLGFDPQAKGPLAVGSVAALPFQPGQIRLPIFDVVVALDVLEHIPVDYHPRMLAELARVTKRLLLVTVPTTRPHFTLSSAAGARHHYASLPPEEWALAIGTGGFFQRVVAAVDLQALGPPFAWGEDNHPLAFWRTLARVSTLARSESGA